MKKDSFYHVGEFIYRWRWFIVILSIIGFLSFLPLLPNIIKPYTATGFFDKNSESAKANTLLNQKLGYSYNRFVALYRSNDWTITDNNKFMSEIKDSLKGLKRFPRKHYILYPDLNKQQVSSDKHTAYAVIMFKSDQEVGHDFLLKLDSLITSPENLRMSLGGEPIFLENVTKQTQSDLNKAEYIGTPAAIIILLIIFGSVVAAFLPILLGVYCALLILSTLYLLTHFFSLSIFTINIALLVGLCLSLDYALFFISRFRDQLRAGQSVQEAIGSTLSTAGKAIFFSGIAVFISISALLFFPINILFSVGIGGLTAVFAALLIALVMLPAILSVLGPRINFLSVRFFKLKDRHYWQRFISVVTRYPLTFFVIIMTILLTLSYPMLSVKFGISDFRILPKHASSRQFYENFKNAFGENELTPILVIAKSDKKNILSSNNVSRLYDFARKLNKDPRVDHINSIVTIDSKMTKQQYQMMYKQDEDQLAPSLRNFLNMNTTDDMTVFSIVSNYPDSSKQTKDLIHKIRDMKIGKGITLQVTGAPANTLDVLAGIEKVFPIAALWIIVFSYLILLVLLRSIVLPIKAIITTTLSLTASYGVLVYVIQQGHFHQFLNFEPQGKLDISLCIIIVCALFGFSMDYEVFLLARIKECYEITQNTMKSIILGIDQSSRIITSAAIIVICLCVSFMSADILIVKAFGLGIAIAIFVDAFLIRLMLVPATMALLNNWNWYLPKWLDRILPNMAFHAD